MKYAWIETQRKAYPLPLMCQVLSVSVSGYRAWKRGGERLMRENGIRGRHKRRYKATTDSRHNLPVAQGSYARAGPAGRG